jgi:hypothetical protein
MQHSPNNPPYSKLHSLQAEHFIIANPQGLLEPSEAPIFPSPRAQAVHAPHPMLPCQTVRSPGQVLIKQGSRVSRQFEPPPIVLHIHARRVVEDVAHAWQGQRVAPCNRDQGLGTHRKTGRTFLVEQGQTRVERLRLDTRMEDHPCKAPDSEAGLEECNHVVHDDTCL